MFLEDISGDFYVFAVVFFCCSSMFRGGFLFHKWNPRKNKIKNQHFCNGYRSIGKTSFDSDVRFAVRCKIVKEE